MIRAEDNRLHAMIHWHGGDHTALDVATKIRGRWRDIEQAGTEAETAALITALVRMMPDSSIAPVLNRLGRRTIAGLSWTAARVQLFHNDHHLLAYRDGERIDRGELVLDEVAGGTGGRTEAGIPPDPKKKSSPPSGMPGAAPRHTPPGP